MPISITCRCGYNISAPERLAGRTLRCPKCLGEFTVPQTIMAPPPPPVTPMPAPKPMAAFASAPTDALALESAPPEPVLEPEETVPLMDAPAVEDAFAMEQVEGSPGHDAPEFGSSDLAVDSQETVAATEEDALGFERGLPLEGDAPVMNEDELGMFLMDEEPPPPPEPKKKKKKK
jgi:hypothetical protein